MVFAVQVEAAIKSISAGGGPVPVNNNASAPPEGRKPIILGAPKHVLSRSQGIRFNRFSRQWNHGMVGVLLPFVHHVFHRLCYSSRFLPAVFAWGVGVELFMVLASFSLLASLDRFHAKSERYYYYYYYYYYFILDYA